MSQHLIEESRVLHPEHGRRTDAVQSGRQDAERDGPGAMRRPEPKEAEQREATVRDITPPGPRPTAEAMGDGAAGAGDHGDESLAALDALSRALAQIAEDQQLLEAKLGELRRQRASGKEWREILSDEEQPGSMQVVSRMLACLAKASGTLRKELVDTLRREGVSIPAIARMFGVTHQRVSNLLRRP
ncbi:MAG: hypothetical protein ACRDYZ_16210 [Acidimicrobiales bacterium]